MSLSTDSMDRNVPFIQTVDYGHMSAISNKKESVLPLPGFAVSSLMTMAALKVVALSVGRHPI